MIFLSPCRFQSTFPRGERRFLRGGSRLVSYFNPRSLVGNDAIDIKFYVPKIDFNPRSLVGNDEQAEARQWQHAISIHVPSWGTTACTSIETGVDLFQSTFPRGERLLDASWIPEINISIHVPSWGTTANFHKYSLFFYAINIIFLLFIIPSLFSLVLFMLLF